MDEDTAKLIIAVGAAVGFIFWMTALALYRRMAATETLRSFDADMPHRQPADAISDLIADGRLISAQARVERPDASRLNISQMGIDVCFEAIRAGGGSRLVAQIDDSRLTRKFQLGLGAFVLILMPLVVGGLCVVLWNYVAPSPTLAVRWQSVQVVQIVHVLWPPFLIYFLWRGFHNRAANAVSNLLVFAQAAKPARTEQT